MIWFEFIWRAAIIVPVLVAISLLVGTRKIGEIRVLDFLFVAILAAMAANAVTSLDTLLFGAVLAMVVITIAYYLVIRFAVESPGFARLEAYARKSGLPTGRRGQRGGTPTE